MRRGLCIIAALGLLALAAGNPPTKQGEQPKAQQSQQAAPQPPPTPQYSPYPSWGEEACYKAKDHDAADLCAQWRAAIAAEKTAHEARRATTWSIVATVFSAFAFGVLVWSLIQTERSLSEARRGNVLSMRENARATRRAVVAAQETSEALAAARTTAIAAERSAAAMEGVAQSMAVNAQKIVESVGHQEAFGKMQMRAYVSVGLAEHPIYQDDQLNFMAEPTLTNTGHTPAHKLRWRTTASIEPCPLPPGFKFELPEHGEGHSILMPHQVGTMMCAYPHRVDDQMVFQTMAGDGTAFYVWGVVEYEDVFGELHETKFAHVYRWFSGKEVREDGIVPIIARSHFLPMHNDAN